MVKWQRALYQPNLPLGENGERLTACGKHIQLSKAAAKEGMVLLKNENNVLPLPGGAKIALFGKGTFDYVKGGGGSGDVTVSHITNLYEGFRALGDRVRIEEELADFYRKDVARQYEAGAAPGMTVEPELPPELCRKARHFTDTAVISICRFSGEGWDRGAKSSELFEDGDFYLSHREKAMVCQVKELFPKVIVVLNVGGMVDSEWFAQDAGIQAGLVAWQGGIEGGRAAAELLCGLGNPSGKLPDTFAKKLTDYPSIAGFHESDNYVDYTEDIYVGYRYFETLPGASALVNYPFGFGLSYTNFEYRTVSASEYDGQISVQVRVINTGGREGKEVIQVYGEAPQGQLGKAKRSLAGFSKTRLLKPGEAQLLTIKFAVISLASFDDLGKIAKAAWVLEAGVYRFYVGTSVRDAQPISFVHRETEDRVVEQTVSRIAPTSLKRRLLSDGSYEALPLGEANNPDFCELPPADKKAADGLTPAVRALEGRNLWKQPWKKGIRPFRDVAEGSLSVEEFLAQMTDEEVVHLLGGQPNTGVANTFGIGNMPEYGVPSVMTADGPAGLRIAPDCGIYTTAWPCATLLAGTWNPDILYQVGEAAAAEVKENNISVWLAPAVNIHRSPLCGRNFEYYSEDPLLTGVMASAMVKGIQSRHIAATVKHFALNNKETNRKNCDSRVSERAAREIYLKAFEIIVKEAGPWCVMTAYNIINGHRASENRELIDGILRGEWGYEGMVMSDWWTYGEHYKEVKAGNDLKMACGFPKRLIMAKEAGILSRGELEACAKRILELILKID